MSTLDTLSEHQRICDEIHQLAVEENRFLRQYQSTPEAALLDRKRTLLQKLDASLTVLRTLPGGSARDPEQRKQLEKTRSRILQILQLDRENEQLLLRYSLTSGRTGAAGTPPAAPTSLLQKIYARCS